jgi:hypothetical protein
MRVARPRAALPLRAVSLAATLLALAAAAPAAAALGEPLASIQADGQRMKAAAPRIQAASAYTMHELQDPNGGRVREYVSSAGVVFALSWSGPFKPDLGQLLGRYFVTYAGTARSPGSDRNHLALDTDTLVVRAGGRQRGFSGRAWAPALVPVGVDAMVLP